MSGKPSTLDEFVKKSGNPLIYQQDEYCHPFNSSITAKHLYQKTIKREQRIKEKGFKLVTIWESEFLKP